jgi:hypothetical protein
VAAGALGLYFAFDGEWPVALACVAGSALLLWLGGVWVLPRSRAAYLRRVHSAWTDFEAAAQAAYLVFSRRRSRLTTRLEQLSPPPELAAEHAGLMALLTESVRLTSDESVAYWQRAWQAVTSLQLIDQTANRLAGSAADDAQRDYVTALEELLSERAAQYEAATGEAEQAGEEVVRSLARMRAPSAAATEHREMVDAFGAYLAAARAFHAAAAAHEPERVAAAAREVDASAQRLRTACAAVSALSPL